MRRILDLLVALNDADVSYVVVGGVAVVLRGHSRMTVDLDLALDLAADNVLSALDVLRAQGLERRLPVATLLAGSDELDVGGVPVRVASVEHLITMKSSSGRPQDLVDIAALAQLTDAPSGDDDEHRR